jgi:hypothetical protein
VSTNLAADVPALQRAVAVPGTFGTLFPDTGDEDLLFTLLDGFAEAQLDGFLLTYTATDIGLVTENMTRAERALVVLYAGVRILQNEIRNRKTHTRYEASGSVFEQDQSAIMLVELLKEYQAQKVQVKAQLLRRGAAMAFSMADQYVIRAVGPWWYGDNYGGDYGYAYGHQGI